MSTVPEVNWHDEAEWMHAREAHLDSVSHAITVILRENFRECIATPFWKSALFVATEFPSKYMTRYVSLGTLRLAQVTSNMNDAIALYKSESDSQKELRLRHDHIWSRNWLQGSLSGSAANVKPLLIKYAWGCVVTESEHHQLGNAVEGWERYREARIPVLDVLTGEWIPDAFLPPT